MENITKSTHPLILVAAASLTIASLTAAAHFSGLLPSRTSEAAPVATLAASAPAPAQPEQAKGAPAVPVATADAAKPASQPASHRPGRESTHPAQRTGGETVRHDRQQEDERRHEDATQRVSANNAGSDVIPAARYPAAGPQPASTARQVCQDCGTVENVREVASQGEGSGLGAIAGGVLGGVLGNQVGRGTGKDLATIAGAVGGAVAGHQVEKNVRRDKQYQASVRFDDGSVRSYTLTSANWHIGDRVRLANGNLVALDGG